MQKHKKQHRDVDSEPPKTGMTRKGCVKVGLPVKGVSSGRVGSSLTGERALMRDENSFPFVCVVFNGNFGVQKYSAMYVFR